MSSDDYLTSPHFSPRERAAVLWAEHVAKNTARERDDIFEEVETQFSHLEVIELTAACGQFAGSNRFQDSLRIPLEEQSEVNKIKKSVKVDPNHIKDYIEKLIEFWPQEFPEAPDDAPEAAVNEKRSPASGPAKFVEERASKPARVPLLEPEIAQGESARFIKTAERLLGGVSNATRMWANIPNVAKLFLPFQVVLERQGAGSMLPAKLKAMVLIRTDHLNTATYSLTHHCAWGRAVGLGKVKFDALFDKEPWACSRYSPSESAALLWAEHIVPNAAVRREDIFGILKQHYNDAEIVELTGLCALANRDNRIYNALRLPLEADADIAALNRTVRIDPGRIKDYLESLIAHWPMDLPSPVALREL